MYFVDVHFMLFHTTPHLEIKETHGPKFTMVVTKHFIYEELYLPISITIAIVMGAILTGIRMAMMILVTFKRYLIIDDKSLPHKQ